MPFCNGSLCKQFHGLLYFPKLQQDENGCIFTYFAGSSINCWVTEKLLQFLFPCNSRKGLHQLRGTQGRVLPTPRLHPRAVMAVTSLCNSSAYALLSQCLMSDQSFYLHFLPFSPCSPCAVTAEGIARLWSPADGAEAALFFPFSGFYHCGLVFCFVNYSKSLLWFLQVLQEKLRQIKVRELTVLCNK